MASGASVLKGEIHNVVSVLRLNSRWASEERFRREIPLQAETALLYSLKELQELLNDHAEMRELEAPVYLKPFADIVESPDASNVVTGMALGAMQKFLLYGIICMDSLRAFDGVNMIAEAVCTCQFEETNRAMDEAVLINLLDLAQSCLRSDVGVLLTDDSIWGLFEVCFAISKQEKTSSLLRATAFNALANMVLLVFGRTEDFLSMKGFGREAAPASFSGVEDAVSRPPSARQRIIKHLSMLADNRVQDVKTCMLALRLTNVALETGGSNLSQETAVVEVLRTDLCKVLLQNSQTNDLNVLTLVLRVVFNLFNSIKEHMKVQLEVFLLSVHVALVESSGSTNEQKELALESLVEFCREPLLMLDLYVNYDCDVNCTNLFETICKALAKTANANPKRAQGEGSMQKLAIASHTAASAQLLVNPKQIFGPNLGTGAAGAYSSPARTGTAKRSSMNVLNKLAIEGILAVIEAIAKRCRMESDCVSHPADAGLGQGKEDAISPLPAISGLSTPLQASRHISYSDVEDGDSMEGLELSYGKEDAQWLSNARERTSIILQERKRLKKRVELVKRAFNGRHNNGVESETEAEQAKAPKKDWIEIGCDLGVFVRAVKTSPREAKDRRSPNPSPASIAIFLKETPGLDKGKIGEYLGKGPPEKYPFHAEVRACYAKLFDFRGFTFHHALRTYLEGFRLPGEAQCIDRLMESFAKQLFDQWSSLPRPDGIEGSAPGNHAYDSDPDADNASTKTSIGDDAFFANPFVDADAAFVLSFSTIMLNTDLHNPNLPEHKRMKLEEFKRNNRGINGGSDLPGGFLEDLYYSIRDEEVKVRHDIVSLTDNGVIDTDLFIGAMEQHFSRALGSSEAGASSMFARTSSPMPLASTVDANAACGVAGPHEQEMFANVCVRVRESIFEVFEESIDDLLVVKCLHGLHSYVRICVFFGRDVHFRIVLEQLLCYAEKYTTSLMYHPFLCAVRPPLAIGEALRAGLRAGGGADEIDSDKILPVPNPSLKEWSGAAAHRGLLAAILALRLLLTIFNDVDDLSFAENALSQPVQDFIVRWLVNLWWHGVLPEEVQQLSRPRSKLAAGVSAARGMDDQEGLVEANPEYDPAVIQRRDHAADRAKRRSTVFEALRSKELAGGNSGFGFNIGLGLGLGNVFGSIFQDADEDLMDDGDDAEKALSDGPSVLRLAVAAAQIRDLVSFQPRQVHSKAGYEPFLLQALLRAGLEKCQVSLSQHPDLEGEFVEESSQQSQKASVQKRIRPPAEAALLLQWACSVSGLHEDEYDAFEVMDTGFLGHWLSFFEAALGATPREKYNYMTDGGLFCVERVLCCLLLVLRAHVRASDPNSAALQELLERLKSIPISVVRRIGAALALGFLEVFYDLLLYLPPEQAAVAVPFREYLQCLVGQIDVAEEGTLVLLQALNNASYFTAARLEALLPLVHRLCGNSLASQAKLGAIALFPCWMTMLMRGAEDSISSCWSALVDLCTKCLFDEHEDVSRAAFEALQRLFLESLGEQRGLPSAESESSVDPEKTSVSRPPGIGEVRTSHWAEKLCHVLTRLPIVPFRAGGGESDESFTRVSVEAQLRSISFVSRVFTANVKALAEAGVLQFAWLAVVEFYGTILATSVQNSMTRESAAQLIVNMIVFLTHEGFLTYDRTADTSMMGFRTWELLDRLAPDVRNEVQILQSDVELPLPNPQGELQAHPALSGDAEPGVARFPSDSRPPEALSPHQKRGSAARVQTGDLAKAIEEAAPHRSAFGSPPRMLAGGSGVHDTSGTATRVLGDEGEKTSAAPSRNTAALAVAASTLDKDGIAHSGEASALGRETAPSDRRNATDEVPPTASPRPRPRPRPLVIATGDEPDPAGKPPALSPTSGKAAERAAADSSIAAPRAEVVDRGTPSSSARKNAAPSSALRDVDQEPHSGPQSSAGASRHGDASKEAGSFPSTGSESRLRTPPSKLPAEERLVRTPAKSTPRAQDLSPRKLRKHLSAGKSLVV